MNSTNHFAHFMDGSLR